MEIIHIVLGKANPNRMNGVNKVVYQLATRQAFAGSDVSVWGITPDPTTNFDERNFKTKLFIKQFNPFKIDPVMKEALLSHKKNTVFHIHGGWIPVFSSISILLKKNNIPFIYTPHGAYNTIAMNRNYYVKSIYFSLFEKQLIKNANKVHCIGQSEVSGLNKLFKTNKTVLLPYGYHQANTTNTTNLSHKKMIIGFVGRIDIFTKGLDLLIDGFEQFKLLVNDCELWIIGDGMEKQTLVELVKKKNLQTSVIFHGSKFNEEKEELIKQMDVFVHPSRNEGLPSSVLEAANIGIPCIVSQATNLAQYIEDYKAGIAIQNENETELKMAFLKIYKMKMENTLTDMKSNAQQMVEKAFNWKKLIVDFSRLYNSTTVWHQRKNKTCTPQLK